MIVLIPISYSLSSACTCYSSIFPKPWRANVGHFTAANLDVWVWIHLGARNSDCFVIFQMEETACIDERHCTQARLDIKCVKLIIGIMADIRSTQ